MPKKNKKEAETNKNVNIIEENSSDNDNNDVTKSDKKCMNKAVKILLIVLGAIASLVVIGLIFLQIMFPGWHTFVGAFVKTQTMTESQIADEKQAAQIKQVESINKYTNLSIPDEMVAELNKGELSESEIVDLLLGRVPPVVTDKTPPPVNSDVTEKPSDTVQQDTVQQPPDTDNTAPGNDEQNGSNPGTQAQTPEQNVTENKKPDDVPAQGENTTPNKNEPAESKPSTNKPDKPQNNGTSQSTVPSYSKSDEKIAQLIARMYVLKAEYNGKVQGVVNSMISDFSALPPEKRTTASKTAIAKSYLGTITSMEAQCDAQVDAVVTELRAVLKESGGDQALADAILSAYASEKETTKAQYINKYS